MKTPKLLLTLPAVALLVATVPTDANARTKDIVKYGAIGLGVAALANMSQQNSYYSQPAYSGYYYSQPSYGYGYSGYSSGYYGSPYTTGYSGYSSYPSYGYTSYPTYGGYYY